MEDIMRVLFKMHVSKFYSKTRRGLKSCDVKNASHYGEQTLNVHTTVPLTAYVYRRKKSEN